MTWLYEEPEGIEFAAVPNTEKYAFALKQSQRKDKNWRWQELWGAIAWSQMSIEVQQIVRFTDKTTWPPDFAICPLCAGDLGVDVEYMQNRYGEAYMYESVQLTYFCNDCEEAGTYSELLKESYDRKDEEKFRRGE